MAPKVYYFYDQGVIPQILYNYGHCMKPQRVAMTHELVMSYGLGDKMVLMRAAHASALEMTRFHTDDYIKFLKNVTPETVENNSYSVRRHNVGEDCPVFLGLFPFCAAAAGSSMEGAAVLNSRKCEVAINWAGGLHHAKKDAASGFCYVNDCVLGILELLKVHTRVLYIDIDVHHGDGVEEAFFTTDRVMTVSLHKYGQSFFPTTGDALDIGAGKGKNYAVNVPLKDGIDDISYKWIFEQVIGKVMQFFQPEAVVLQCGADSLSQDKLGPFNLSMNGHAACVSFVQSFNIPMLVLGGGGYRPTSVARTWAFETGTLLKTEMPRDIPRDNMIKYKNSFSPYNVLEVPAMNATNHNSREYLQNLLKGIVERLRGIIPCPSAPYMDIPESWGITDDMEGQMDDEDTDLNMDARDTVYRKDKRVENPGELMEGDGYVDEDETEWDEGEDMDDVEEMGCAMPAGMVRTHNTSSRQAGK